ncbi:unnamed protein product [Plutella xylostella]|uniref:(diamondback moth) hypothetical protein n=1 Tax=Plutella xylostella TaxID=51655 RepID=A0A8S4FXH0_PLUXY|nr:unnamed protein product [Plutella xylostella]
MNPPGSYTPPAATASSEIAMVTVQMRVPDFWPDLPSLWFSQFEAIMAPQKQSDSTKFDMVVSKLGRDALRQVTDIIKTPPATDKYKALKERLLAVYEESAELQFQRLVSDMDLGSQKPSQLLRRMSDLAKNSDISDGPLKNLWISRLPPSVRAVLAASGDTSLQNLASIADKILENLGNGEIAAVSHTQSHTPVTTEANPNTELIQHLRCLTLEVKQLRGEVDEIRTRPRGRSHQRGGWRGRQRRYSGTRSSSRSYMQRRAENNPEWLCYPHYRYRENARSCHSPCNWSRLQSKETKEN